MCEYVVVSPTYSSEYGNHEEYTYSSWKINGNHPSTGYKGDDWGVVGLEEPFYIGYLNMLTNTSNETGREIRIQGYPGYLNSSGHPTNSEKYFDNNHFNNNLYLATGKIARDDSAYQKLSDVISYEGMSGGPVMYKDEYGRWGAGGIISGRAKNSATCTYCAFDNNLYEFILSLL